MAKRNVRIAGVLILLACTAPAPVFADDPAVMQLFLVDAQGDVTGFVEVTQRLNAIADKHQLKGTSRVVQATIAGAQSGLVSVVVEYPDFASLAQALATMGSDPEVQQIAGETQGKFRLVSRSIWTDISPK